jgi:NarL family two-component system response regulator LiaR
MSGPSALDELTARENEVLRLMARNRSNEQIAQDLYIAVSTVKTHINHILRKLGQEKRMGAVLEYQRLTGLATTAQTRQDPPHLHPPT